jgi:hypothetical protein
LTISDPNSIILGVGGFHEGLEALSYQLDEKLHYPAWGARFYGRESLIYIIE